MGWQAVEWYNKVYYSNKLLLSMEIQNYSENNPESCIYTIKAMKTRRPLYKGDAFYVGCCEA